MIFLSTSLPPAKAQTLWTRGLISIILYPAGDLCTRVDGGSGGVPSGIAEGSGDPFLMGCMSTKKHKLHEMRVCVGLTQPCVPSTGHKAWQIMGGLRG